MKMMKLIMRSLLLVVTYMAISSLETEAAEPGVGPLRAALQTGRVSDAIGLLNTVERERGFAGLQEIARTLQASRDELIAQHSSNSGFFQLLNQKIKALGRHETPAPGRTTTLPSQATTSFQTQPTATPGPILIKNSSGYDILVTKYGQQGYIGRPFRINKDSEEIIADSLEALQKEGVKRLSYGHSSDLYAGRSTFSTYGEQQYYLPVTYFNRESTAQIGEPIYQGSTLKGTYYWQHPTITLEAQIAPGGAHTTVIGSVYDLPIFRSIPQAAQEYKYMSHRFEKDAYTPVMLRRVDEERWACLILGLHRPDFKSIGKNFQIQTLQGRFINRLQQINTAEKVGTITNTIANEARTLIHEAVMILLHSIGEASTLMSPWEAMISASTATTSSSTPAQPSVQQQALVEEECPICLEQITQANRYITPCRHIFHKTCIDAWKTKNHTCPLCRGQI